MSAPPPANTKLEFDTIQGQRIIRIPYPRQGASHYLVGGFLLFWLCGWAVGFLSVFSKLLNGEGSLFLFAWLGGWTLAGLFAARAAYQIIRGSKPQVLTIEPTGLRLDTGKPPVTLTKTKKVTDIFGKKRKLLEFSKSEIGTLNLRETSEGNRLTIDKGADRIDLAEGATEVDREWLFKFLKAEYT